MQELDAILTEAQAAIQSASDLNLLDQHRVHYLGKKGILTEHLKSLGKLTPEERPAAGQRINQIKIAIQEALAAQEAILQASAIAKQLAEDTIDITLPGRQLNTGSMHPINHAFHLLEEIFTSMGFDIMEGPEIEDDYHNFAALNIPPLHPARAMQDTFYFNDGTLLRSHVSPVQIHAMHKYAPPIRMVTFGKVYRRDFDITHTPMFHQMECLMVAENITFANLKNILTTFLHAFFAEEVAIRLRPSYFPFTEPSAEVDISCMKCKGNGCRICKNTGYLEVLGCGMVHPNVLKEVNIDIERYQGFAFGAGIDRLAMLKYGITDLRSLFENDLRFLSQF